MPDRPLSGLSGFGLRVTGADQIRKIAANGDGARLRRQCEKQSRFGVRHPKFHVCEITQTGEEESGFFFTMPFYRGDSATQFVCKASPRRLDTLGNDLADLVDELVGASPVQTVAVDVVRRKSEETVRRVRERVPSPGLDELCAFHLDDLPRRGDFRLPVGRMHGDLTLSNIIFAADGGRYILIDFLDAYLETPMLDIAKLRQETRLAWSSLASSQLHDAMKYRIAMARLDEVLSSRFAAYPFVREYADLFDFQNLLRVLPYARDPTLVSSIVARLAELRQRADTPR